MGREGGANGRRNRNWNRPRQTRRKSSPAVGDELWAASVGDIDGQCCVKVKYRVSPRLSDSGNSALWRLRQSKK